MKYMAVQVTDDPALMRKMVDIASQLKHDGYVIYWTKHDGSYVNPELRSNGDKPEGLYRTNKNIRWGNVFEYYTVTLKDVKYIRG